MSRIAKTLGAVGVSLAVASAAVAQSPGSKACTEQERNNQTLGEKLGQSGGVICPPEVDPGMKAPTPEAGNTPVIPPPGSPGGDPSARPK